MNFKVCTSCKYPWPGRDAFLSDPKLRVIGYQVNFGDPEHGLFLFNHNVRDCGTTLAIEAGKFTDMYDGPVIKDRLDGKKGECPGYCLYESKLVPCPAKCNCAYVREVLQKVKKWPKASSGGKGAGRLAS